MLVFENDYIVNSPMANYAYRINKAGKSPFKGDTVFPIQAKACIEKDPVFSVFGKENRGIYAFNSYDAMMAVVDVYFKDDDDCDVLLLDYDESDLICETQEDSVFYSSGYNFEGEIVLKKANILHRFPLKVFVREHRNINGIMMGWQRMKPHLFMKENSFVLPDVTKREGELNTYKMKSFLGSEYSAPLFNSEIHGIEHSKNVLNNAVRLAGHMTGIDRTVCCWFAFLHDIGRTTDGEDKNHGVRASEMIDKIMEKYLSDLTITQITELQVACTVHNNKRRLPVMNNTKGCCIDADRLDLPRVGIIPTPSRMTTEPGFVEAAILCDENGVAYDASDYKRYTVTKKASDFADVIKMCGLFLQQCFIYFSFEV